MFMKLSEYAKITKKDPKEIIRRWGWEHPYCGRCAGSLSSSSAEEIYVDSNHRPVCPSCMEKNLYKEGIIELTTLLNALNIPHNDLERLYEGWALTFPWCDGDVACHRTTYGGRTGLLETYCFSLDDGDVHGYLTPKEALEIILHDWNKYVKNRRKGK